MKPRPPPPLATLKDIASHVAAWQHRHPLARRLQGGAVQAIGTVSLPFAETAAAAPDAPDVPVVTTKLAPLLKLLDRLPEPVRSKLPQKLRAMPPAAPAPLALFSEDLIPGLSPARIARFALQHGQPQRPGEADWPQREVAVDPADATALQRLHLLTAAIDHGGVKTRVLLAADGSGAVLGRRPLERRRMAVAAGLALALIALLAAVLWLTRTRHHTAPTAPHQATAAARSASEPASAPHATATAASHAVDAEDAASRTAPPAAAPHEATSGSGVAAAAASSPASAAAAHGSEAVHAAASAPPPSSPPSSPAKSSGPASTATTRPRGAPASSVAPQQIYALMSRGPRSRAEAEQLLIRFKAAAATLSAPSEATQIEVLNVGGSWHVLWWPFPNREAATVARWALALKGVTVDVVDF